jgi:hypothetical protein
VGSIGAFLLLILGMVFKWIYDQEDLFYIVMILSTIIFFMSGAMWLGVTHIDPVTGAVIQETGYKFLVYLMIVFGFIPILLLYEVAFGSLSGTKEG